MIYFSSLVTLPSQAEPPSSLSPLSCPGFCLSKPLQAQERQLNVKPQLSASFDNTTIKMPMISPRYATALTVVAACLLVGVHAHSHVTKESYTSASSIATMSMAELEDKLQVSYTHY